MRESLSIEEVRTLEAFEALAEVWDELAGRADCPHLSSTFAFAFAWWKNRSYGNQLFILLLKDRGRLVGIAPLMISEVRWGIVKAKKVSFMLARYLESDFIVEPDRRRECIRLVIEYSLRTTGCHYMEFCGIPEESGSLPVLKEVAREMRMKVSRDFHSAGCYLPIEGSWDSFMKRKSARFRKNARYYAKQLRSKGRLETVRVRRTDDPVGLMNRIVAVDRRGWKAGWVARPENRGLMSDLLTICNENGWLDIFFEELDGVPISYLFMIRFKGKAYAMFTAYRLEHASDSPGFFSFSHALEQLFQEQDVHEVDFLSSYEYLRRWTDHLRKRYLVTLYRGGLSGQAVRLSRGILHGTRSVFAGR